MKKLQTLFRNASIAVAGSAVAVSPAFASIVDEATTAALQTATGDGESVGKLIVAAVAIIVGVSLVIGMMRKA